MNRRNLFSRNLGFLQKWPETRLCSSNWNSTLVFFPKAFEEKKRKWCLSHDKGRKQLSQSLHSYPDALLVRWYNRDSSKMNGITINAIHDTRSPDLNGWFRTALMAAACSTSTADPVCCTSATYVSHKLCTCRRSVPSIPRCIRIGLRQYWLLLSLSQRDRRCRLRFLLQL